MNIYLNTTKRGNYIVMNCDYQIDVNIMKTTHELNYNYDNTKNPNLIAVINHYMKEQYNINNYIPHIINDDPKIISKTKNVYYSVDAHGGLFSIANIEIINKHLFEIVISIVNELITCSIEYLNEKN